MPQHPELRRQRSYVSTQLRIVRAVLLRELFSGVDPMDFANSSLGDDGYPHTHMRPALVGAVLRAYEWQHRSNVSFWLECGSMLGGSLIRTAKVARQLNRDDGLSLVAIDPFTGDVNMWAGEAGATAANARFRFLGLRHGQPTIYHRFLANVARAGLREAVLPIRATATVGLRLLGRLHRQWRLPQLPQVIYLDSAHEQGETLHELTVAWSLLPSTGGVLFGDDWGWTGVHADLLAFLACLGRAGPLAVAQATELGRQLGEPALQRECRPEPTPAALMRHIHVEWGRTHSNTGRFCVEGGHELAMFGVGQWVLFKTPESRTPTFCAPLSERLS